MLEEDITKKGRVDENTIELDTGGNNKEYQFEAIWDNAIYANESTKGYLPELYYLVSWKSYPEEENSWERLLAIR